MNPAKRERVMEETNRYKINTEILFQPLELVDVPRIVMECKDDWFNQSLCNVNDCVVRLGILKGDFHWHKHEDEDEFFYVLEGRMWVDLEDKSVEILAGQGFTVPRGVRHRTRAPRKVVILMVEGSGVVPTGD
jgi:mannose-6-phosphate isomerase-like protein (cupin superfamily)